MLLGLQLALQGPKPKGFTGPLRAINVEERPATRPLALLLPHLSLFLFFFSLIYPLLFNPLSSTSFLIAWVPRAFW